ncbi:MAG: hypothetical protein ABJB17_01930 [Burkholderiales bacterium]
MPLRSLDLVTLLARDDTVSPRAALHVTDPALLLLEPACLVAREFAPANPVVDALLLPLLMLVDARGRRAGVFPVDRLR